MTKLDEAYKIYANSHTTTGNPNSLLFSGKLDAVVPMAHSKESFCTEILINDKFNKKWGKGFTRTLSYEQRVDLEIESRKKRYDSGFVTPGLCVDEKYLDSIGIPKREFIDENKEGKYKLYVEEVKRQLENAKREAERIPKLEKISNITYDDWYSWIYGDIKQNVGR